MNIKYKFLNSFQLKLIALATMFIDHLAVIFFEDITFLRIVGRISFVIFSFLLVEGFIHTRNLKKYMAKMGIWAILSEVPYDLAINGSLWDWKSQNIFFTLFCGLLALWIIKSQIDNILKILNIIMIALIATALHFDYYYLGVVQIVLFYVFRKSEIIRTASITVLNCIGFGKLSVQSFSFLGLLTLLFYNGERGRKTGDIFYSFYAIHLLIFAFIKHYLL